MENESEIKFIDAENYRGEEQNFSYETLIMMAMKKTIESGSREMKAGFYNSKIDRSGNQVLTYIEDTRKAFIESVKNLKNVLIAKFDEEAEEKVNNCEVQIRKIFLRLCIAEKLDWESAPEEIKRMRWRDGTFYRESYLSIELPYYQEYLSEEVRMHRKIFEELIKLVGRRHFFGEVEVIETVQA